MALENILSQEIIQKLGWTLLHFIWQAAAVALLLTILLALLRKAAANVRYIVACAALGLIVLLPIVTIQLVPVSTPQPIAGIEPTPAPVILPAQEIRVIPAVEMTVPEAPVQHENVGTAYNAPWKQRAAKKLEPALPYIVTGWLLGVFGLSLWHLGGWAQLQRLRKKMVRQVDESLYAKLRRLSERLRVKRAVQLAESALVQVPTVVGWLRPVILLPASALTGLSSEQLEAILAHELAHIRRHDYLINMLQTLVETLGFYHPAVWWVSHKIRIERENCCDDLAVSISGDRIRYAKALTSMEEIRGRHGGLAVAAAGGNLFGRIRRLVGKDSTEPNRTSWIPSLITIMLIAIIIIPTALALTTKSESQESQQETEEIDPNSWQEKFYSLYSLEDGQVLKRIAPPFIPERRGFFLSVQPGRYSSNTYEELVSQRFNWDGDLSIRGARVGSGIYIPRLKYALEYVIGLGNREYDIPPDILSADMSGDWIVRKDSPQEELLQALERIVKDETSRDIDFVKKKVETEVIIAEGKYNFQILPNITDGQYVLISTNNADIYTNGGGGSGTLGKFLRWVGNRVEMNIIDETEAEGVELSWRNHDSSDLKRLNHNVEPYNQRLDLLLKNLSRQTGLTFERKTATVEKWFISEDGTIKAPQKADAFVEDVRAGTITETPASTMVVPIGRHALLFDGVDDCLHVPASPTLQFKPPFTIEMWIKPDLTEIERIKASGEKFVGLSLLRKGKKLYDEGKEQAGGFAMFMQPPSIGNLYYGNTNGIMFQTGGGDGSALMAHPEWLHISVSCTRKEYIPVHDEPLIIGEAIKPPTFLPPFKGQIAEIRIWNKVFTHSDPCRYGDTALTGSEPNLIACWDFEHTKGQMVYDISPNANHAYMGTSMAADNADPQWASPDAIPHEAGRKANAPVEIDEGRIEGRIIDINTGKGISGVEIAAVTESSPASNERFACTSAEDGTFAIGGLQSGEYLLQGDFPSVDVDVVSGRCTNDVLIGVRRGETVPALKETTAEQQRGGQVIIGMRVIELPADAMKDVFEPNESLSSGWIVRNGYEIAGRLLTLMQERKDAKQLAYPQVLMNNNINSELKIIRETVYTGGYESVVGEPGKLTAQPKFLETGWKYKIKPEILESGEKVHMELALKQQKPVFETRQYQPGYDYQIPVRPEIFVTEVTAKNGEPVVICRLRSGEPASCLIVTPSVLVPEPLPEPLLGKKLPEPDNIQNIDSLKQAEGKPTLVCFWDMNQRPSRNLIGDLATREKELAEKNVAVYLVHTSKAEPAKLKEWLDNQNVPFVCGSIENDADDVLFRWGVKAQPWFILTDQKGIVQAEGFDIEQLDGKLQAKSSDLPVEDEGKAMPTEQESTNQQTITGVVRDEQGKPVEGVEFRLLPGHLQDFTSNAEGKFEVDCDLQGWGSGDMTLYLVARHKQHNLATIVELDENVGTLDIKLKPGVVLFGKVVDPEGKGIAGAWIMPYLRIQMMGISMTWPQQRTDSEGYFEIKAIPAGYEYDLWARADGYGQKHSEVIQTDDLVANCFDVEIITLPVANLSVSGIVVDANDEPVANAAVSYSGEGQPHHLKPTDSDGKFIFEQVCDGLIRINANTYGTIPLRGSVNTYGGATDVKVVVTEQGIHSFVPKQPPSLVGSDLPKFQGLGMADQSDDLKDTKILLCFWNVQQRPSRNLVGELAKREKELKAKDVAIVLVDTSQEEPAQLKQWLDSRKVTLTCGNIEGDAEKLLFSWGVRAQPWLILTDEKGVVRAEGFGLEQLDGKLKIEESTANNSSVPLLAKSAPPSDVDKPIVKVDLSVVEVFPGSKMDRETTIAIENLLGGKITLPDSPAVADLLRKAAGATAAVKDESAGDKRVTDLQFKTLFDILVSRGFVKILMNPTLEVVDGGTAQIRSEQKIPSMQDSLVDLIQITPNVLEDGNIILQVNLDLSLESAERGNEQTPIVSKRQISTRIRLSPGESGVIGGMKQAGLLTEPGKAVKDLEVPTPEMLVILTPTIVETAGNQQNEEMVTRVYHIYDLVLVGARISRGTVDGTMGGSDGMMGAQVNIPDQAIVNEAQKIVNLIIQTIAPNSWYENNPNAKGIISPYPAARPRKLAIYQTLPAHQQILKHLKSLRRERTDITQISIELRYLYTNMEFLDEVRDSINIEFTSDTFLDDKQVETLLRASQKKKNIKSMALPIVKVLNNEAARFKTVRQIFMSFLDYYKLNNLPKQSQPVPVDTFCSITPHIEDNKNIIIDFVQDIPGLQERIIYDRRDMVQSYTETTAITNKRIPKNKTFVFACNIKKVDQDNQAASPAEKKTLIVLIKPTIIVQEEMPRSEAAATILNSQRSKGYTAEQSDETISLKSLPEEQPGTGKDQIMIDIKILTASDDFLKYIGLDPNSVTSSESWSDYLVHSTDDSASFVIDQLHADLILKALAVRMRTDEEIQMLHKPQVLAKSGKKFEIHIPQSKSGYYMLIAPTEPNGSSVESESKSNRIDTGTTVRLTPNLTPDRKNVELDFEWEYRRLRGIREQTGPDGKVQKIPIVDVDRINTPCTLPDGKTLLITGKKIIEQKKEPKKPRLSDLPLIGGLFSNPPQVEETKNLLIMITPSTDIKAPPIPQPIDPNDPLIKQLEGKFKRSAKPK